MGKVDLVADFPSDLFCSQILARLPLKEAVRFSAVSRKWFRSWTRLSHLKFSKEFFDSVWTPSKKRKAIYKLNRQDIPLDIVNKIITMQRGGLESFELSSCDKCESSIHNNHKWLLWISSTGVKPISLKCSIFPDMEVSESLFSCVTKVTPLFQGFPQLVTCSLLEVELSGEAFQVILKLCPRLQSLTLRSCRLRSKIRMISSSLKHLALLELYDKFCLVETNCPNLESIKAIECYGFEMANMCLPACVHLEVGFEILEYFAAIKSVKKITCFKATSFSCVRLLQSFPCLEELCIDSFSFTSESGDLEEFTLQLANLKTFVLKCSTFDDKAVLFCSCVLRGAPLLKTVTIGTGYSLDIFAVEHYDRVLQIINNILSLGRDFPKTKISLSKNFAPSYFVRNNKLRFRKGLIFS